MQNFVMGEFHELQALAKINLRLKVVGRLENGHHLLQMVNVLTSLSDSIKIAIKKTPSINIQVSGYEENGLPSSSSDNIIYETIHSFFSAISLDYGADVLLEKNIPIGAGLGGGSSDAATILRYLSEVFSSEVILRKLDLFALGTSLGADIPYLLNGGLALVEGIGEVITPIQISNDLFSNLQCAILVPNERINTAQAFKLYREHNPEIRFDNSDLLTADNCFNILNSSNNFQSLLDLCENDLTAPAELISNQVKETLALFKNDNLVKVCLTGSGSAMFVLPKDRKIDLINVLRTKIIEKNINFLKIIHINLLV